ncbi:RNA polymerase sigma factor [Candidatus Uabimicrobium sp. HlEnr_7]|uniref:RNA polymerase sigma factor n=1 Tax=Candidatus Uabimicrobium helgolandensis TaxID=3095367 RepID=UPI0035576FDE
MYEETQWSEIQKIAASDFNSENQIALTNIIKRFQKPLRLLFSKRLMGFYKNQTRNHSDDTEEMLAEFYLYLLEKRQSIFSRVDKNKGKLRTFLYTIAWRFSNDYLGTLVPKTKTQNNDFLQLASKETDAYQKYEIEYVNVLVNRALSRLKAFERNTYHLFKKKYFSHLSAKNIAIEMNILDERETNDSLEVARAENNINKKLSRGRHLFFEFIKEEIIATLPNREERLLEEEMQMLKKHIGDISLEITR